MGALDLIVGKCFSSSIHKTDSGHVLLDQQLIVSRGSACDMVCYFYTVGGTDVYMILVLSRRSTSGNRTAEWDIQLTPGL